MITLLVGTSARAAREDCWPVAKELHAQVVRSPMNDGNLLVVVEDSVCGPGGDAPPLDPAPIVPVELRRELSTVQLAVLHSQGRDLVPLGPVDFHPVVESVVAAVERSPGRVGAARVDKAGPATRVLVGDAAFLDQIVDVNLEACPLSEGEPWTVHTVQYCILDQIDGEVFAPRLAFPGWAGRIPNRFSADDVPLLDALIRLYTANGVQPLALFFLTEMSNPPRGPVRRIALEVHYPTMPPLPEGAGSFEEDDPGRPGKVPRPVPGDDD